MQHNLILFSRFNICKSPESYNSCLIESIMSPDLHRRSQTLGNTRTNATVKDSATSAKPSKGLISWDKLPDWAKDNEFIDTGYRRMSFSYLESLRSCFSVHNETGNIYSHLLATLWMVFLPVVFLPHAKEHYPSADMDDWTVFGLYFLGGALCFGLSTSYHAVSNHSYEVHDVWLRLDLFGISTVTAGCFPPGMWYTFPCADRSTKMFWITVRRTASVRAINGHADNVSTGRSHSSTDSGNNRLIRQTVPAASMATSSGFPILLHGIFRLLPDHIRLLPEWVPPDGRRSWCHSICLDSGHLLDSSDHLWGTSPHSRDTYHVLLFTHAIDQNSREMEPRILRSLGPVTPNISCSDGRWTHHSFLRLC